MELLYYFISAFGLGGIIIALGKYIIDKSVLIGIERYKNVLNMELETHKTELLKKTEEYRYSLQKIATEHQIRYNKLHEERGEFVKNLFEYLIDLQEKLEYFTTKGQGPGWNIDENREINAISAHEKLKRFFETSRIFYPSIICTQMDKLIEDSWQIIVNMSVSKMGDDRELWSETNKTVNRDFKALRRTIQDEFKKLLGVE